MSIVQFLIRGGTETAWTTANTVLAYREVGLVYDDTNTPIYMVVGDGVTGYANLTKARLSSSTLTPISLGAVPANTYSTIRHDVANNRLEFLVKNGATTATVLITAAGGMTVNGHALDVDGTQMAAAVQSAQDAAAAAAASAQGVQTAVNDCAASVTAAAASATLAGDYSDKGANQEVATGRYSAFHWSEQARGHAQAVAGLPMTYLAANGGTGYTHTLNAADRFSVLQVQSTDCTGIIAPRNWHTAAAADGRISLCPVHIINYTGSNVVVSPATSQPATVSLLGDFSGTYRGPSDTAAAVNIDFTISVPAGTNRKLWVAGFETNTAATSHTIGLTVTNSTSVTKSVADTGPTGTPVPTTQVNPFLNSIGWTVPLADATSATSHTLTFALPARVIAYTWRALAFKDCASFTCAGSSSSTAATEHVTPTISAPAHSMVAAAIGSHNGSSTPITGSTTNPAGTTQLGFVRYSNQVRRDHVQTCFYNSFDSSASITFGGVFGSSEQWAYQSVIANPLGATADVTLANSTGGTYTIPNNRHATLFGESNGLYFHWVLHP